MTQAPLGGKKVGKHPTTRGKSGATRRLRTEGGGVPIGLAGAQETSESVPVKRPAPPPATPQGLGWDTGDDDEVRDLRAAFGCTAHIRARGFVERTPRGMHRFQRGLIRGDKKVRNSLGCLHFACADLTSR
jgi:hypothetical protein